MPAEIMVSKSDLSETRTREIEVPGLGEDQALVEVERCRSGR